MKNRLTVNAKVLGVVIRFGGADEAGKGEKTISNREPTTDSEFITVARQLQERLTKQVKLTHIGLDKAEIAPDKAISRKLEKLNKQARSTVSLEVIEGYVSVYGTFRRAGKDDRDFESAAPSGSAKSPPPVRIKCPSGEPVTQPESARLLCLGRVERNSLNNQLAVRALALFDGIEAG
jgi:hypothetical protein